MFVKLYLIALPIFLFIDTIWLTFVAKDLFRQQIGPLMRAKINWAPAIILYLLLIAGLVLFVIIPAIKKHSWQNAFIYGAVFGLITYATFDLTNLAILKNWPLGITFIDLAWGTVLAALASLITYFIARALSI